MSSASLNLARKWRSKNFDTIVGQELSIRMLKNSLYLDHYFPVYLFAGSRGCGKTTTARVFAAAINCEKLSAFQKDPKNNPVPCLVCSSCEHMLTGKHPDFIEIDAASHTGVDNVRQIIEAASLLPLIGRKKIYLIDEAHMLSKAAFNAFLKILEEPPHSTLFILATTDTQKIIDTVRSRCFQLFFNPVLVAPLVNHLKSVCTAEKIAFDEQGLELIIKETEGSVRDALNVVEQVRFAAAKITKQSVLAVLGHLDDERLLTLFGLLLAGKAQKLLSYLNDIRFNTYAPQAIFEKLIELVRAAIWLKYGVEPSWLSEHHTIIKKMIVQIPLKKLSLIASFLYSNEELFGKTTAQHSWLEMILLQMCDDKNGSSEPGAAPIAIARAEPAVELDDEGEIEEDDEEIQEDEELKAATNTNQPWLHVVALLEAVNDPLITSLFTQGSVLSFEASTKELVVEFSKELIFFQDTLQDSRSVWLPIMQQCFGVGVNFKPQFTKSSQEMVKKQSITPEAIKIEETKRLIEHNLPQKNSPKAQPYVYQKKNVTTVDHKGKKVDISDGALWKKATMLTHYFPGTVYEFDEIKK